MFLPLIFNPVLSSLLLATTRQISGAVEDSRWSGGRHKMLSLSSPTKSAVDIRCTWISSLIPAKVVVPVEGSYWSFPALFCDCSFCHSHYCGLFTVGSMGTYILNRCSHAPQHFREMKGGNPNLWQNSASSLLHFGMPTASLLPFSIRRRGRPFLLIGGGGEWGSEAPFVKYETPLQSAKDKGKKEEKRPNYPSPAPMGS